MIRLHPPNAVLYDSGVVRMVDRFHKLHKEVEAYVTSNWTLVFIDPTDPESYITLEPEDWLPEYGDFYKHKEPPDGSSQNEQKAQE